MTPDVALPVLPPADRKYHAMSVLQKIYIFCQYMALIYPTAMAETSERVDFNSHIRPILSDNCFFCHGPDATHREGGLRLDLKEAALDEGDSGLIALVPGKPEESELMKRILELDPDLQMPKPESGKHLSHQEIELLRRWIEQGAEWEDHWAYRTPSKTKASIGSR